MNRATKEQIKTDYLRGELRAALERADIRNVDEILELVRRGLA